MAGFRFRLVELSASWHATPSGFLLRLLGPLELGTFARGQADQALWPCFPVLVEAFSPADTYIIGIYDLST